MERASSMEIASPKRKSLEEQALIENRVIVRIWTSLVNPDNPGASVGHVSLDIPNEKIYWSFWPKVEAERTGHTKLIQINPVASAEIESLTYQKDVELEDGRPPALVFCFYTLEVHKIKAKFQELCKSGIKWNLVGRWFYLNAGSCASSAWELLIAGEIRKLVSKLDQSSASSSGSLWGSYLSSWWSIQGTYHQSSSNQQLALEASSQSSMAAGYASQMAISFLVDSPDYIGSILRKAKEKELQNQPLTGTKALAFKGESPIIIQEQQPHVASSWRCNIL